MYEGGLNVTKSSHAATEDFREFKEETQLRFQVCFRLLGS